CLWHRPGQPAEHAAGAVGHGVVACRRRLAVARLAGRRRPVFLLDRPAGTGVAAGVGAAGGRLTEAGRGMERHAPGPSGQHPQPQAAAVLCRSVRGFAWPAWGLGLAMLWMTLVVLLWDLALVRLLDQAHWRGWLQRHVRWLDRGCGGLLLALGGWLLLGALSRGAAPLRGGAL